MAAPLISLLKKCNLLNKMTELRKIGIRSISDLEQYIDEPNVLQFATSLTKQDVTHLFRSSSKQSSAEPELHQQHQSSNRYPPDIETFTPSNESVMKAQSPTIKNINEDDYVMILDTPRTRTANDLNASKVSQDMFVYSADQSTLICGECDFSFTASLIRKRGNTGAHLCCTAWYYYKSQWYDYIPTKIGWKEFAHFLRNVKFCKANGANISFGIDAKTLDIG
eukprot:324744_1